MRLVLLILVIFTFFNPKWGSIVYIVFAALMGLWVILANISKVQVNNENGKYTPDEIEVIERYHLFFRYPFISRILSTMFSGMQIATFILVPWLLFKGQYIQSVVLIINYFVTQQLSVTLNPQFFLHDNVDKGKIKDPVYLEKFVRDMHNIDSALEKMYLKNQDSTVTTN